MFIAPGSGLGTQAPLGAKHDAPTGAKIMKFDHYYKHRAPTGLGLTANFPCAQTMIAPQDAHAIIAYRPRINSPIVVTVHFLFHKNSIP